MNTLQVFVMITIHLISGKELTTFICKNGSRIDFHLICNGIVDCIDQSDETKQLCQHVICPKGMFRCHYGACILNTKRCDDQTNCADGSDERQCGRFEDCEFSCESNGECIHLEQICDGHHDCPDGTDEKVDMCLIEDDFSCPEDTFHCKRGGGCVRFDARCDRQLDCVDGSDESGLLCRNLKCTTCRRQVYCPALEISRLDANCYQGRLGRVPCDNPVPIGTVVSYKCREYFEPINERHKFNKRARCQFDGTWSKDILKCRPECGTMMDSNAAIPLVVKGLQTNPNLPFPWHGTMYVQEVPGVWVMWCGGTLITEKLTLTAAHCSWKLKPSNIKTAFGKYYSLFYKRQPFTQVRNVKQIITHPLYQDRAGNYGSDLSILVLEHPVTLTLHVQPACIDFQGNETHLRPNNLGLTVGMGVVDPERLIFSDKLRAIRLPVVSYEECVRRQLEDFKKFITLSVFCAGWLNGSGVCNGDSGGGLLFPKWRGGDKWVLQGVVSISPRRKGMAYCDPSYYTLFTKINIYLDWLREIIIVFHHFV